MLSWVELSLNSTTLCGHHHHFLTAFYCRQQQQQTFSFAISFLFSFLVVLSFSRNGRKRCFMSFCPTKHKTNQLARQPANQFSRSVQWKGEKTHWNVALLKKMMMMMVKKKWKLFPLSLLSFFWFRFFEKTTFGYNFLATGYRRRRLHVATFNSSWKRRRNWSWSWRTASKKGVEKGKELKGVLALIKYSPRCGDLAFLLFSPSFLLSLSGDRTITQANTHTHPQRGFTKDSGLNWFFSCFVFLFVWLAGWLANK